MFWAPEATPGSTKPRAAHSPEVKDGQSCHPQTASLRYRSLGRRMCQTQEASSL